MHSENVFQAPKDNIEPKADRVLSDSDISDLKIRINNLVWMYGPPSTTLAKADELACEILGIITSGELKR